MSNNIELTLQRMKQARKERGMSQRELAEKTGISNSAIAKYELGNVQDLPINKVKDIANALGVPLEWLMGIDEGVDGVRNELHRLIDDLTEEECAAARLYLDFLKTKDK